MAITDFTIGKTVGTTSTKIKHFVLAACLGSFAHAFSQCDLEIVGVDLVEGTVSVSFNNTTNCGGTGGPDGVSEIQFGFQALDGDCNAMNVGWDFPTGLSTSSTNNHPGWLYSSTTTEDPFNWTNLYDDSVDPPYYAGEVVDFPIYNVYQSTSGGIWYQMEDLLAYWIDEGYSIQVVIWQISYGPTMYAADGGWAEVGANGDGTSWGSGLYEDANFLDNWYIIGPCGECVPEVVTDTVEVFVNDTIVITELDTIETLVTDTVVEYDTTYVQLPPDTVETLVIDTLEVFVTDTLVINDTIPVAINWYFYDTTYIYLTDTVVETDTLYVTLTDTLYTTDTLIVTQLDTLYVDIIDTLYVDVTDTLYVTLTDSVYIPVYQADTINIYEYDMVEVDCSTGEPCINPFSDCEIYIPNSFTPDNDGVNDYWGAVTDDSCWLSWSLKVFSRSGEAVWESYDPNDIWLGGDEYYVPADVYIYMVQCEGYGEAYIINGHVTVVR